MITQIGRFRDQGQVATVNAARSAAGFKSLLRSVTRTVATNPVEYIQNLGGVRDQFLFDCGSDSITLLPGVAYCLRRFPPLVQQLYRSHWIDHIKRNKQNIGLLGQDNDLESFLFETSMQSLVIVQAGLRKLSNHCLYCGESVRDVDVDHLIPHSLYPMNLAHNFVLAHPACNRSKSVSTAVTMALAVQCNAIWRLHNVTLICVLQ